MADNTELTDFELKCCIIEAIKEQHPHIYDRTNTDHFNRAKLEASFHEIGTLLNVDSHTAKGKSLLWVLSILLYYSHAAVSGIPIF